MGTVVKALSLLHLFSREQPEIGLSDMARLSGMNKATVYRLLGELQAGGLVEQTGGGRSYRLGAEVLHLAALREAHVPMLSVAQIVLSRLSEATGETAHMSLLRNDGLVLLTHVYSTTHATRVMMDDADDMSFHGTGSGLAVMAFAAPALSDRVLAAPLPAHTAKTITDPAALRVILRQVRATGVAESIGGFERDVHSHAAPVFGPDQLPIGAIAVAAPETRVTPATRPLIRRRVLAAARALTYQTGGLVPSDYPAEDVA